MKRRSFLASSLPAAALAAAGGARSASARQTRAGATSPAPGAAAAGPRPFHLKYAPHFGMFRQCAGDDPVAQIDFMADEGFTALEDNGMRGRAVAQQEAIAGAMSRRNMEMGIFVATMDFGSVTFAGDRQDVRERLEADMRDSVEVANRVNARWCTVVMGLADRRLEWGYQTANAIENLKRCAAIFEPAGLVMVIEPLNPRDHPGLFLTKISQAYEICRAVGSPSCKILDDLYHQQVTEGNLIPNIDAAWDEIGYFQVGDNPGRNEPTTGEINYRNVFRHIHEKGYTGIVGLEHGNSMGGEDGERRVIDAYRESDAF